MGRYTGSVCRQCRALGKKLFLKGQRCYSEKCSFERRQTPPGPKRRRGKATDYSVHLKEKQIGRRVFGIYERQFRNYFIRAKASKGVTGEELVRQLETRLDNVIFRLGWASSRALARQLVLHRHFKVNGRVVNIPSYGVSVGDKIEVKDSRRKTAYFREQKELVESLPADHWLKCDLENWTAQVERLPETGEMEDSFDPALIVEYYSKLV
ncbi:MAG: 30S ribosomal protein S4 [bacterium]|jgi:small subunit ribosomal protein S4